DGLDFLGLELALLVSVVGLHGSLVVENDGDVRVLVDVVAIGAGGVVEGEDDGLEARFLGEGFEFFLHALVIGEGNNETAHAGGLVLAGFGVDLLDQTGQVVGDLACEDHRDGVVAVPSDLAELLAGRGTIAVQRMERSGELFIDLRTGFELRRGAGATKEQRHREGSSCEETIPHRKTSSSCRANRNHVGIDRSAPRRAVEGSTLVWTTPRRTLFAGRGSWMLLSLFAQTIEGNIVISKLAKLGCRVR